MVPRSEGKEGHYITIGEWNLLGGFEGNSDETGEKRVRIGCGGLQRPERADAAVSVGVVCKLLKPMRASGLRPAGFGRLVSGQFSILRQHQTLPQVSQVVRPSGDGIIIEVR